MPGPTHGASPRHTGRVKRMEIEMHDGGGYTVTHHHVQDTKGEYKEPATHVHGHHGSLMDHIHTVVKKHGKDQKMSAHGQDSGDTCEYCSPAGDSDEEKD